MEALDVVKDIGSRLGAGVISTPVDALPLQHSEEALGRGVVRAATHRAHAADQVVADQEALILGTGELASPIRVQDDRPLFLALPQRHQHRLDNKLALLAVTHRPADNDTRVQIQHDAQVQPVLPA